MIPAGSTWRRNPIPPCKESTSGGAYNVSCPGPAFPPPVELSSGRNLSWAWGYGPGSIVRNENATREEILKVAFNFGIVDKVVVPDVPPGDYVLQFRWDCESFSQVWESCADVTIVSDGANTEPFSLTNGCHVCCPQTKSFCSNCTGCLNDKTGDCAYCWIPFPDLEAPDETPLFQCLGYEAEDGGAPEWNWGDHGGPTGGPWSPGCPKCWADETACQPHFRGEAPSPTPPPQCLFEKKEETCFATNNLKKVKKDSVEECCDACQSVERCTHFTYTPGDRYCGLKAGTPVDKHKHTHCTSGIMQNSTLVPHYAFV